jgi:cold shock CspA family protein
MDIILKGYLAAFCKDFELESRAEDEQFEHFVNYCIASTLYGGSVDDLDQVHTGKEPGIDGAFVIANDHLIGGADEVEGVSARKLQATFCFVQAKRSAGFEESAILKIGQAASRFFHDDTEYSQDVALRLYETKKEIYKRTDKMDLAPSCLIFYAAAGEWHYDPILLRAIEKIKVDLFKTQLFSEVEFRIVDLARLKTYWKTLRHKITRSVRLDGFTPLPSMRDVEQAYLGVISCKEYMKLVTDENDQLLRGLFYDNVRDFQGDNEVNVEISETLRESSAKRDKFVIFNNGVTIIAKKIKPVGKEFVLEDFQVVNGCQTTHVIYLNRKNLDSSEFVPIKLISTESLEVSTNVIQATNRQTAVLLEAFETLRPYHKELEEFFLSFPAGQRLYYERRSKQYDGTQNVHRAKVVSLTMLIKTAVALILEEPHSTSRYFGELLKKNKERLFVDDHEPYAYYACALCMVRLEEYFKDHPESTEYRQTKYLLILGVWRLWLKETGQQALLKRGKQATKLFAAFTDCLMDVHRFAKLLRQVVESIERSVQKAYAPSLFEASRLRKVTELLVQDLVGFPTSKPASTPQKPPSASSLRIGGQVKDFGAKMFGFIDGEDGKTYWFHISDVTPKSYWLDAGVKLSFVPIKTVRGIVAKDILLD